MRLLRTDGEELVLETFNDERKLPKYAILSHTWLKDTEEVTFQDLHDVEAASKKQGWKKLDFARKQAWKEEIEYVWLDTCCIDKSSSAELAEAINSMYRWYQQSQVCYVYLDDLKSRHANDMSTTKTPERRPSLVDTISSEHSMPTRDVEDHKLQPPPKLLAAKDDGSQEHLLHDLSDNHHESHEMAQLTSAPEDDITKPQDRKLKSRPKIWKAFRRCKWFTRGWTLQEMIAPSEVRFYNQDWVLIGHLFDLADEVASITGVHSRALKQQWPIASFSIAQRMCWAANRETTRAEDRAYSLLGIFDVSMPVVYGEGERAFLRLQQELLRVYSDQTIFAWLAEPIPKTIPGAGTSLTPSTEEKAVADAERIWKESHLLAQSPNDFEGCERMVPIEQEQPHRAYQVTNREVSFELALYEVRDVWRHRRWAFQIGEKRAVLNCCLDHDPTKAICIKLLPVTQSENSYYVGGIGARIEFVDLYHIAQACTITTFTVLLSVDQAQKRQRLLARDTIICRIKEPGGPGSSGFSFLSVQPAHLWEDESNYFRLNPIDPKDTKADHSFKGSLTICHDFGTDIFAKLELNRGKEKYSRLTASFQNADTSRAKLSITRMTPTAPLALSYRRRLGLSASVTQQQLVRDSVTIVELEIVGLLQAAWLLCQLSFVVLIALAVMPMTVVIPILVLRTLRIEAYVDYSGDTGPDFDKREIIGLAAGITLSSLWGILLVFDGGVPLRWRPKSWIYCMPWVLALASLSLSGVYCRNANRHRPEITAYRLQEPGSEVWAQYGPREIFVIMVLRTTAAAFEVMVLVYGFFKDDAGPIFIYARYLLMATVLNVATLVPLALVQANSHDAFTPWTTRACEQQLIPISVDSFYDTFSNRTNQTYFETCREFSNDGRLLWSVLSLGVWEFVLEVFALFQLIDILYRARKSCKGMLDFVRRKRKMVKRS